MLKRWATWPRGIRWSAVLAAVALALAIAWVLFVPTTDWLAHHDVGPARGSLHEMALDDARGRLLTLGAGLFAAGALIFTAQNFTLSRRTFELTEQGQVTDRYTKAIEQLGSEKLDIRIGGIYALERIARDSARDHPTIIEVLTAFIREYSREPWPPPDPAGQEPKRSTRPDVQAALTVVGRRDLKDDTRSINLRDAILSGADLSGANLRGADLRGANLRGADLHGADLSGANLSGANLSSADLHGADLHGTLLGDADLTGANLIRTNLIRTDLRGANLRGANLRGADLSSTLLHDADLTGAYLYGADLTGATLPRATLSGAGLGGARWPGDAPIPEGWKLNTSSGRLEQVGTDPDRQGAN
jgi:hypothetical protein